MQAKSKENQHGKNYEGEFTLEELRQINRVFQLTNTIYDAQEEGSAKGSALL